MPSENHNRLQFTQPGPTSAYANPLISLSEASAPRPFSGSHPDSTRIRALAVYAETGNQTLAAKEAGVSREALGDWVHSSEGQTLIDELRAAVRYQAGWQLAQLVQRSVADLSEAMHAKRGKAFLTKSGAIRWAEPSVRDEAINLSILLDKWMLVSGAIAQGNQLTSRIEELSHQMADLGASLMGRDKPTPPPSEPLGAPSESYPPPSTHPGENLVG